MLYLRSILIFVIVGLACAPLWAGYDAGDGSLDHPFEIAEPNQLVYMSQHPEDWNKNFLLTADINMNLAEPNTFTTALIAPDTDNSNYSFQGTSFTGVLDGNGHTISNLTIDAAGAGNDYLGLFGLIDGDGSEIKNLGLVNVNVTGGYKSYYLGGLCGYNYFGTIDNCYATGSVTGGNYSVFLGGLCGENSQGSISNCYSNGSVTGGNYSGSLGGLCGKNSQGSISNCYSNGSVTGGENSWFLGGLCGSYSGTIDNCYATGSVSGGDESECLGGLCGEISGTIIDNCYATGSVIGGENSKILGGLCGYDIHSTIDNCYATGSVTGGENSCLLGGLCGLVRIGGGSIPHDCYFLDTAGPDNGIGSPLTDSQMKQQNSFTNWDFVDEDVNGENDIWRMCVDGIEYPKLYWQFTAGDFTCPDGVGTEDLVHLIQHWLQTDCRSIDRVADINGDDIVDLYDFSLLAASWLVTDCGQCSGADLDGNEQVDLFDNLILMNRWLDNYDGDCGMCDLNDDGIVNILDYSILSANWLK